MLVAVAEAIEHAMELHQAEIMEQKEALEALHLFTEELVRRNTERIAQLEAAIISMQNARLSGATQALLHAVVASSRADRCLLLLRLWLFGVCG